VGSEGIDLQFCSILFNYDLPWNPMRVEQRIGRIDRLGQKAEKIHIYNFASFDTVEEKILIRLYERIGIFEESVGDMEEILGETASKILDDVYNPELTDDEKMTRTEASLSALENKRKLQNRIEENAINLIGFSDYIYKNINTSKENQRWISKQDLLNFIADFFAFQYKGTVIEMEEGGLYRYRLSLSPEARSKLSLFISEDKPQRATRLHQLERVLVSFETDESNRKYEKIDILHPLILWIRKEYDQKSMHPVSAIELDYQGINNTCAFVEEGTYFYRVHRWKISGLKEYEQLIFLCFHYESGKLLEDNESEKLVLSAVLEGRTVVNARNTLEDTHTYTEVFQKIDAILQARYEALYDERSIENMRLCSTQKDSARMYKDRKLADLTNRIQKFREEGKDRLIPMTQGLIDKEESIWLNKVTRIEAMEGLEDEQVDIAAGVIVIR
jgi:hypothetical protein